MTRDTVPSPPSTSIISAVRPSNGKRRFARVPAVLVVGVVLALLALSVAIFGPVLAGVDPAAQSLPDKLTPPGQNGFLLGSDLLGRDMLSRIAQGFWWSVPVALVAATIATVLGAILGFVGGWSTGIARQIVNQLVDLSIAFPYLVLAILLVAILGTGFWPMTLALGLIAWVSVTKIVFTEVLSLRSRQYIVTAQLQGMPTWWILVTYVFRAVRARIIVSFAFIFASLLVAEASLSFLGLGAPVGLASWGSMLRDSREYMVDAPWLLWAPGGMVVLVVLAGNLIGDGLIRWLRGPNGKGDNG